MKILSHFAASPHGYALVQHIQQRSNDLLQVEEGSLYPALQRLLKAKLVKAEWGVSSTNRRVRTYQITASGVSHLEQQISSFERMFEGIGWSEPGQSHDELKWFAERGFRWTGFRRSSAAARFIAIFLKKSGCTLKSALSN